MSIAPIPQHKVRWERVLSHELEAAFTATPAVYFAYGLELSEVFQGVGQAGAPAIVDNIHKRPRFLPRRGNGM